MTTGEKRPSARIEIGLDGGVEPDTRARELFPRLEAAGLEHPLLKAFPDHLSELDKDRSSRTTWTQRYAGGVYRVVLEWDPSRRRFVLTFEKIEGGR